MTRFFVRRPVVLEASPWHRVGDHDAVTPLRVEQIPEEDGAAREDGVCRYCGREMAVHGWVNTLEGGHIVCPGDWIIKGVKGEFYACKPDVFAETYEEVEGDGLAIGS
jgi:hypothetical protein